MKKKKNPHESLCHLKTQFDRWTAQLLEQCPYKLIEREPTPAEAGIRKPGKTINFYINVRVATRRPFVETRPSSGKANNRNNNEPNLARTGWVLLTRWMDLIGNKIFGTIDSSTDRSFSFLLGENALQIPASLVKNIPFVIFESSHYIF